MPNVHALYKQQPDVAQQKWTCKNLEIGTIHYQLAGEQYTEDFLFNGSVCSFNVFQIAWNTGLHELRSFYIAVDISLDYLFQVVLKMFTFLAWNVATLVH